jgi:hypothetical protein
MRYKFDLGKSKIQDTNPELEVLRIKITSGMGGVLFTT